MTMNLSELEIWKTEDEIQGAVVRCAGELTELPVLYKAKLNFVDSRLSMTSQEKILNFMQLITNSISKGLFPEKSIPSGLGSTIGDLEKILINLRNNYYLQIV